MTAGSCSRRAAFRPFGAFAHVLQRFVPRVGAHVHQVFGFIGAGDPTELCPVVFYLFLSLQLIEVERRIDWNDRQPVRLRDTVNIIGGDQWACRWHVLHDDIGIAR